MWYILRMLGFHIEIPTNVDCYKVSAQQKTTPVEEDCVLLLWKEGDNSEINTLNVFHNHWVVLFQVVFSVNSLSFHLFWHRYLVRSTSNTLFMEVWKKQNDWSSAKHMRSLVIESPLQHYTKWRFRGSNFNMSHNLQ